MGLASVGIGVLVAFAIGCGGEGSDASLPGTVAAPAPDTMQAPRDAGTVLPPGETGQSPASAMSPNAMTLPDNLDVGLDEVTGACGVEGRLCRHAAWGDRVRVGVNAPFPSDSGKQGQGRRHTLRLLEPDPSESWDEPNGNRAQSYAISTSDDTMGHLIFGTPPEWRIDGLPERLGWAVFGGDPAGVQVQGTLRDEAGQLLAVTGLSPLVRSGSAKVWSEHLPEVKVRWRRVGCEVCPPDSATETAVALVFIPTDGGEEIEVLPGERKVLTLAGVPYLALNEFASWPVDGDQVRASTWWSLTLNELLVPRDL